MKPGVAFPDYIRREEVSPRPKRGFGDDATFFWERATLLPLIIAIVLALVAGRLFFLQVVQGSYYRGLSDQNRVRSEVIHAPRGILFDRNGASLVFNVPGFKKTERGKTRLIEKEQALSLIAKGEKHLEITSLRNYPLKEAGAHVLGYIGEISQEEIASNVSDHHLGDFVGRMGVEQHYEEKLRGRDGRKLVEVDSKGETVRTLGEEDPVAGQDVTLTIDRKLQEVSFGALGESKGAVVATTAKGEILTLVSKPSFDPNLFTMGEVYSASSSSYASVDAVLSDSTNQPFLNRAISGAYPPGSTFKLITAAAGLEGNVIDERFSLVDPGVIQVGAFSFSNWYYTHYGKTDGELNIVKGIKRSNDIFFYRLAEMVGVEKLSAMARSFGLGELLGIDISGEAKGLVPTPQWKREAVGEAWYLGDTYHYGIGQGYVLTTPLQVNSWTEVIANNGTLYKPHLLKNSKFLHGRQAGEIRNSKFLSEKTVSLIRQGMVESCSPGGVAWPLFEFKVKNEKLKVDGKNFLEVPQATVSAAFKEYRHVSIACKTGTAQHGTEKELPHAWITLFAPAQDPQIIITVLAESSGEGSNIAAPIAKKILEEWFGR